MQPKLIVATRADYLIVQNMARFYAYDLSRDCGFISDEWEFPQDGLYESHDFKDYFESEHCKAYLIKIAAELGGFVLINKLGKNSKTNWNMGQFFIVAKFQNKGIGKNIAYQIFDLYPGIWEVAVIPENKLGLIFWTNVISRYTGQNYKINHHYDASSHFHKIIFDFNTEIKNINIL